ncbi:hypothetical protein C8Q78DRAFT_1039490 [Trametes maxima]|nr:hypothetical protein C8Q78DRAFT_1045509 [Trametes maxima]KAI0670168.1 hypothetical protein C8Q78DRAFT_1039490 [Trametes maxima]
MPSLLRRHDAVARVRAKSNKSLLPSRACSFQLSQRLVSQPPPSPPAHVFPIPYMSPGFRRECLWDPGPWTRNVVGGLTGWVYALEKVTRRVHFSSIIVLYSSEWSGGAALQALVSFPGKRMY